MGVNQKAPNWNVAAVDPGTGVLTQTWFTYLVQLSGVPGPIAAVKPTGSPFTYTASGPGSLIVQGGTVSAITLSRALVSNVDMGVTQGSIPMAQGDTIQIIYSATPALNFVPG